jgi:predicted nuclease of predicted toxin-antitoxin system
VHDDVLLFLADENFNNDIVRGLLRRQPGLNIVRVQDVGLRGAVDAQILARAAQANRILLTHDVSTITRLAMERVQAGQPMPGMSKFPDQYPLAMSLMTFNC